MLLLELTTIANIFMAPLHLKNESLKAIIEALKMEVLDLKVHNSYKAEFKALKLEVQELKTELLLSKTSITSCVVPVQAAHKMDAPKPKEFKGNQSAKDVESFIWSMEQYFGDIGI